MLPGDQRLRSERDFRRVFRSRRRARGRLLSMVIEPNNQPKHRFGFVVSKTVSKRAVDRNLIKRRLRHAVRELTWPATPSDIVVMVQAAALNQSYQVLKEELHSLIPQLNHVRPHYRRH